MMSDAVALVWRAHDDVDACARALGEAVAQDLRAALELAADAQYSKGCAALTVEPPVEVTTAVLEQMRQKLFMPLILVRIRREIELQ